MEELSRTNKIFEDTSALNKNRFDQDEQAEKQEVVI